MKYFNKSINMTEKCTKILLDCKLILYQTAWYLDTKSAYLVSIHVIVKLEALVLVHGRVYRSEESSQLTWSSGGRGLDVHVVTSCCTVSVISRGTSITAGGGARLSRPVEVVCQILYVVANVDVFKGALCWSCSRRWGRTCRKWEKHLSTLNLPPSMACLHHFLHNLDITILLHLCILQSVLSISRLSEWTLTSTGSRGQRDVVYSNITKHSITTYTRKDHLQQEISLIFYIYWIIFR